MRNLNINEINLISGGIDLGTAVCVAAASTIVFAAGYFLIKNSPEGVFKGYKEEEYGAVELAILTTTF